MNLKVPRVGVGVFIIRDGKILLGKRKNSHGDGCWAPPGGHMEFGESFTECAMREVEEETGLKIKNVRFLTVTNDIFENEQKHYVTIFLMSEYDGGMPEIREPDKCERWEWFEWEHVPDPLFLSLINLKRTNISLNTFIK